MFLYMIFVDFTKAFDIVNREDIRDILWKLSCPDHFKLIPILPTRMKA